MRNTSRICRILTKQLPLVMLILSPLLLSKCAGSRKNVIVIPADRKVTKLSNGNYEVTPAWLHDRYNAERTLLLQLEKCEKK